MPFYLDIQYLMFLMRATKIVQSSGVSKANCFVNGVDLKKADSCVYFGKELDKHHNLQPKIVQW